MKLIIIQGGAATGKSTMANKLADSLKVPHFRKDEYKEKVYNQAGGRLGLWKWFGLERESYTELYKAVEAAGRADKSLLVEGNFLPFQRRSLEAVLGPNCRVVEIYCYAKGWTMFKRYIARNEDGTRHPGHRDRLWYGIVFLEALCAQLGFRWYKPLKLSDNLYKVDTSQPNKVNYMELADFIKTAS